MVPGKHLENAPTFTILLNKQFTGSEGYILQSTEHICVAICFGSLVQLEFLLLALPPVDFM
jgi:hypothetical protein